MNEVELIFTSRGLIALDGSGGGVIEGKDARVLFVGNSQVIANQGFMDMIAIHHLGGMFIARVFDKVTFRRAMAYAEKLDQYSDELQYESEREAEAWMNAINSGMDRPDYEPREVVRPVDTVAVMDCATAIAQFYDDACLFDAFLDAYDVPMFDEIPF